MYLAFIILSLHAGMKIQHKLTKNKLQKKSCGSELNDKEIAKTDRLSTKTGYCRGTKNCVNKPKLTIC
jgi:hypothetical protein